VILLPVIDCRPQFVVWIELSNHFFDVLVGGFFQLCELLVLVVLLCLVSRSYKLIIQGTSLRRRVHVVIKVEELLKSSDFILEFIVLSFELNLVLLHDIDEFSLLLLQVVALLRDLLDSVSWGAKQTPLSIEVFVLRKLELELLEDAVHLHA